MGVSTAKTSSPKDADFFINMMSLLADADTSKEEGIFYMKEVKELLNYKTKLNERRTVQLSDAERLIETDRLIQQELILCLIYNVKELNIMMNVNSMMTRDKLENINATR